MPLLLFHLVQNMVKKRQLLNFYFLVSEEDTTECRNRVHVDSLSWQYCTGRFGDTYDRKTIMFSIPSDFWPFGEIICWPLTNGSVARYGEMHTQLLLSIHINTQTDVNVKKAV